MDASGGQAMKGAVGMRTMPRLAALAWAVAAVSVAGVVVAWILAAVNRDLFDLSAQTSPDRFMVAYAVAGAVVASRRPANPIGWLLLGIGLVTACRALAGEYAQYVLAGHSRPAPAEWAAWLVHWSLALVFPSGVLLFLLLLFPDGRLLTARWRAVGWVGAGLVACSVLGTWLDPSTFTLGPGQPSVPNPTGVRGWTWAGLLGNGVFFVLGAVCLLLAGASVVVRYRRSAGEERLQLKWFAYAVVVSLALMFASLPLAITTEAGGVVFDTTVVVGIALALPLAIGIAVLKYRLYTIDKIISRTVSYALVTGLVAGVYLGCVALLTKVAPLHSSAGIAAAVLVAAAVFNPLRRRVQAMVDRHFNRARYDAERVVAEFSHQLREQVDLDVLGADLLAVVNQVLAPEQLALWLSETASSPDGPGRPSGGLTASAPLEP
jgi:hypothetical protein